MVYVGLSPFVIFFIAVSVYRHSVRMRNIFGMSIEMFNMVNRVIRMYGVFSLCFL